MAQGLFTNPYSAAVGGAAFSDRNNPSVVFCNPAFSAFTRDILVYVSYTNPYSINTIKLINSSLIIPGRHFTFSTGIAGIFHPLYKKHCFVVNTSASIRKGITAGVSVYEEREFISGYYTRDNLLLNFGVGVSINQKIIVGISARNFGILSGEESASTESELLSIDASISPANTLCLGVEFTKEKNFPVQQRFCGIITPVKHASILFGMVKNPDEYSIGLSIKKRGFSVEYVVKIHQILNPSHIFGVTMFIKQRETL